MSKLQLPDTSAAASLLDQLLSSTPEVGPQPIDRPLVLYGAGKMGHLAADLLQKLGATVEYAVDRMPPPNRLLDNRIPVLRPEEVPHEHRSSHRIAVSIVFSPFEPIRSYLAEMGWQHITPFYDIAEAYVDSIPLGNGWFCGGLESFEADEIRRVLSRWDDDHSRAAHLQFLAWRMHRLEWVFDDAPVTINDRYFIEAVRHLLTQEEYFLDGGAYHGGVIEEFLKHVKGRCKGITAIEPDPENAAVLETSLQKHTSIDETVRIVQCALGETSGRLPFQKGMHLASRLIRSGAEPVTVCSLDDMNVPATLVKLHLEGNEFEALRGGIAWLRCHRPILAVTVYHHRDGIYNVPKFLLDHLEGYRLLLRNHAWCGTGVVLYGIPRERFPRFNP